MNELGVTLGKYNNSMNFIFGLTSLPDDFDINNNPYVEYISVQISKNKNPNSTAGHLMERMYEFESCTEDLKSRFMEPHMYFAYDQPLCHKNRDSVVVQSNWFFK